MTDTDYSTPEMVEMREAYEALRAAEKRVDAACVTARAAGYEKIGINRWGYVGFVEAGSFIGGNPRITQVGDSSVRITVAGLRRLHELLPQTLQRFVCSFCSEEIFENWWPPRYAEATLKTEAELYAHVRDRHPIRWRLSRKWRRAMKTSARTANARPWSMTIVARWIREGSVAPGGFYDPDETQHLNGCTLPPGHKGACDVRPAA